MARSGQVTVAVAGTAERGPSERGKEFMLMPHPDNSGLYVWVGESSGDVDSDSGFPLLAAGPPARVFVNNLNEIWFDVSANGDKICWLKVR